MIYLYKKTHKKTGLKYLGKTTQDPYKYNGSGVYWERHLKTHGYDIETEILFETLNKEELKEQGLYYTKLWNIVESDEWANLKPETGDGGGGERSDITKEKIRDYQKNKKIWTEKALDNRLNNCLKSAASRKNVKNPDHGQKIFTNYVMNNEEIIKKIWDLFNSGLNRRQISLSLDITWDRVNLAITKKIEILNILENQNY